tara:strand:+ start:1181 stop:3721 length:2541 start_codon:yes stop_codon:yes gene_type:complete
MKKFTLLVAFLLIAIISNVQAKTVYVSASGSNSNDGLTSINAVETLSNAYGKAVDGDTIQIDGSGGTINQSSQFSIGKNLTFQGVNNAIIEGFTGSGPRMFNLNNDSGKTVVFKDLTIQNMTNSSNGNVFNMEAANNSLTLENITVLNCNSVGGKKGGVLQLSADNCDLIIKNSYFDGSGSNANTGNQGGCLFVNNTTADVTITNSTFRNYSVSNNGGAMMIKADTFTGINITVADNECTSTSTRGAGIRFDGLTSGGLLQNSVLYNNSLPNKSGGIDMDISGRTAAETLVVNNSIMGRVNNDFRTKNLALAASTDNVYGNESGSGSPVIAGWAFDDTLNVYKFVRGATPDQFGKSSYLAVLEDQLGETRVPVGDMIDAGAFEGDNSESINYYVATGGSESNDGLSTGTPWPDLSHAVSTGVEGSIINIDGSGGVISQDAQLTISKDFTFKGINSAVIEGWTGSGPRMFNLGGSGKTVVFKDLTIQDMTNTANGNVFNLEGSGGAGSNLTLENISVLNCSSLNKNGGVLNLSADNCDLTINKCFFDGSGSNAQVGNQGGCLYINSSTADITISNSTFRKFSADSKGGAIFINAAATFAGVNLTVSDNTYTGANTGSGAGIHFQTVTSGTLQNSVIYNNHQPNRGDGSLDMDVSGEATAGSLVVNNSVLGQVTNTFRDENLALVASTVNVFGNEGGIGSPVIAGWVFNATLNVYEFDVSSTPNQYGESSYLSVLEDQRGFIRHAVSGKVDAGAYEISGTTISAESIELEELEFAIYPNPASSMANIVLPNADAELVEIYATTGQKVAEVKVVNGKGVLDVQNLKSGIYIVRMTVGNQSITKKLIVTR